LHYHHHPSFWFNSFFFFFFFVFFFFIQTRAAIRTLGTRWWMRYSVRRRPVINLGNKKKRGTSASSRFCLSLNQNKHTQENYSFFLCVFCVFVCFCLFISFWWQVGYWNLISGRGCQPCGCDGTGAIDRTCHPTTGACYCLPGVGGQSCDRCLPGFFGFSSSGCKGSHKILFHLNWFCLSFDLIFFFSKNVNLVINRDTFVIRTRAVVSVQPERKVLNVKLASLELGIIIQSKAAK
jgi:hypothetical protein